MKTCAICRKPLTGGAVVHTECVPRWRTAANPPEPPINPDGYLCRFTFSNLEKPVYHYMVLSYLYFEENPHFQHEGSCGLHVTHWMPLPKAPEDNEE